MTKLVAEEVNDFVTRRKPTPVCDLCIVKNLGLGRRAHANQITAALGTTSQFVREKGSCPDCKLKGVMVIRAVTAVQNSKQSELRIIIEVGEVVVKFAR